MCCNTPSPACDAGVVSARTAYLVAEGFVDELEDELGAVELRHGRLLIAGGPLRPVAWAANIWLDPREIAIASISDAAAKLRAIQRNWAVYAPRLFRRAMLIQEQPSKVSAKPLVFGIRRLPLRSARGLCSMPERSLPRCIARARSQMARFALSKTARARRAAPI